MFKFNHAFVLLATLGLVACTNPNAAGLATLSPVETGLMSQVNAILHSANFSKNFQTVAASRLDKFSSFVGGSVTNKAYSFNGKNFSGIKSGLAKLKITAPAAGSEIQNIEDALGSQGLKSDLSEEDIQAYVSYGEASMRALSAGKTSLGETFSANTAARALKVAAFMSTTQLTGSSLDLVSGDEGNLALDSNPTVANAATASQCAGAYASKIQGSICAFDGSGVNASIGGFTSATGSWIDAYSGKTFPPCDGSGPAETGAVTAWSTNKGGASCHNGYTDPSYNKTSGSGSGSGAKSKIGSSSKNEY